MSEENAEALRAQIEALNRGDMDAWLEGFDPDVEFREPSELPGSVAGRGRESALTNMQKLLEVTEDLHVEIEEITELEPDRLLLITRVTGRGRGSGIPIELLRYDLVTVRNGKIVHSEIFLDRAKALKAAGLSEHGPPPSED